VGPPKRCQFKAVNVPKETERPDSTSFYILSGTTIAVFFLVTSVRLLHWDQVRRRLFNSSSIGGLLIEANNYRNNSISVRWIVTGEHSLQWDEFRVGRGAKFDLAELYESKHVDHAYAANRIRNE